METYILNAYKDVEQTPGRLIEERSGELMAALGEIAGIVAEFERLAVADLEAQSWHLYSNADKHPLNTEAYQIIRSILYQAQQDVRKAHTALGEMKQSLKRAQLCATAVSIDEDLTNGAQN